MLFEFKRWNLVYKNLFECLIFSRWNLRFICESIINLFKFKKWVSFSNYKLIWRRCMSENADKKGSNFHVAFRSARSHQRSNFRGCIERILRYLEFWTFVIRRSFSRSDGIASNTWVSFKFQIHVITCIFHNIFIALEFSVLRYAKNHSVFLYNLGISCFCFYNDRIFTSSLNT